MTLLVTTTESVTNVSTVVAETVLDTALENVIVAPATSQVAISIAPTVIAEGAVVDALPEDWYSVKDYGALGNNTGDDSSAINAAIVAASADFGGVIYFPGGTYRCLGPIIPSTASAVSLVGVGAGLTAGSGHPARTVIYFPTDLGSGVYAYDAQNGWQTNLIQGIKFLAPFETPVKGTLRYAMDGIRFGPALTIRDCVISGGFHAGLVESGDHAHIENVRSGTGNYYGLYYPGSGVISHGDNRFIGCNFSGCAMSSIGVHGNNECAGDLYLGTHLGFSPYAIYKETAGTDPNILINSHFIRSSFEQIGNAAIYDSTGVGVAKGNEFHHCGVTVDSAYRYSGDGGLKRGWVDVGTLAANIWSVGNLAILPQYGAGASSHVYTSVDAYGNKFSFTGYSGNSKPFFGGTIVSATMNEVEEIGYRLRYRGYQIAATVAIGDCVEIVRVSAGVIGVQKAVSGSGKPLAGMVVESAVAAAGGVALIMESGRYPSAAGPIVEGAVTAGDRLTPDGCATAGNVKTSTSATDRIFAVSAGDVANGNRCVPFMGSL